MFINVKESILKILTIL